MTHTSQTPRSTTCMHEIPTVSRSGVEVAIAIAVKASEVVVSVTVAIKASQVAVSVAIAIDRTPTQRSELQVSRQAQEKPAQDSMYCQIAQASCALVVNVSNESMTDVRL